MNLSKGTGNTTSMPCADDPQLVDEEDEAHLAMSRDNQCSNVPHRPIFGDRRSSQAHVVPKVVDYSMSTVTYLDSPTSIRMDLVV